KDAKETGTDDLLFSCRLHVCDFLDRFGLNSGIISEAGNPEHVGFAAEPGHLALGIVSMRLLRRLHGGFTIELASHQGHSLFVTESGQRAWSRPVFLEQGQSL